MYRLTILIILGLLNSLTVIGQRHDNLLPLFHETTENGEEYRTHYNKLTSGLSKYPKVRTLALTWYPAIISIEDTGNNSHVLFYRGYKDGRIRDSDGNLTGLKKPKKIIRLERPVDTLFVNTLQRVFEKAISKTSYGELDIIITHPTFYYFYTWVAGQGIICGSGEASQSLPKIDRLIGLHGKLVKYSKSNDNLDELRLDIIKEAESLLKEYN